MTVGKTPKTSRFATYRPELRADDACCIENNEFPAGRHDIIKRLVFGDKGEIAIARPFNDAQIASRKMGV